MYIFRPIEENDIDAFEKLASIVGPGITSLPRSKKLQQDKVTNSIDAFHSEINAPKNEVYLFVLENLLDRQIIGCSAIYSRTGVTAPSCTFKIETVVQSDRLPEMPTELQILHPITRRNGSSKIGTLFIHPDKRKEGLGRLLSLARFLFMASYPERFGKEVRADMRAWMDENGRAVFWEGIVRKFLNVEYNKYNEMLEKDPFLLGKIMPQHSIYACLLPKDVQESIGKIHSNTKPALKLLQDEGFKIIDEIDIDGGPIVMSELHEIRTVKNSKLAKVEEIVSETIEEDPWLISNGRLDFRACIAPLIIRDDLVKISKETAEALQVNSGDTIRYVAKSTNLT